MARHNTAKLLQFEMDAQDGLFIRFRDNSSYFLLSGQWGDVRISCSGREKCTVFIAMWSFCQSLQHA
jgi:hypothetical protein